ncbi:MAG: hypothetical protein KY461_14690, partial [Actinobacteria bacterium]|nr:hypothetical protein [Actinomycetota bacterium]
DVRVVIDDGLVASVDPGRMEQVLANLLTNAAKHGAPPVEVAARSVAGDLELRVTDHGPGVPGEAIGTLFSPFAEGADAGSVGLGLWVVHTLTAAHGGSVDYRPDAGRASFLVHIPGAARSSSAPSGVVPTL